jgi:hypothetical protein
MPVLCRAHAGPRAKFDCTAAFQTELTRRQAKAALSAAAAQRRDVRGASGEAAVRETRPARSSSAAYCSRRGGACERKGCRPAFLPLRPRTAQTRFGCCACRRHLPAAATAAVLAAAPALAVVVIAVPFVAVVSSTSALGVVAAPATAMSAAACRHGHRGGGTLLSGRSVHVLLHSRSGSAGTERGRRRGKRSNARGGCCYPRPRLAQSTWSLYRTFSSHQTWPALATVDPHTSRTSAALPWSFGLAMLPHVRPQLFRGNQTSPSCWAGSSTGTASAR